MDANHHVGLLEKVAYGLGDFASNLIWTTTLTYIVFYYTDIYLIPAGLVAVITLVCRTLNAVIDPVIGVVIDRRQQREKARPLLKWGAAPLAVATFLAFVPIGHAIPMKVTWALLSFILLSVTYSVVNVAYGMLTNLMTSEAGGRLRLSSARFIGAAIGSVFIGWITIPAVDFLGKGDRRIGFMAFMGLVGVVSASCFLVTRYYCRERVIYRGLQAGAIPDLFRALLANRPWVVLTVVKFLGAVASTLTLGMMIYASIHLFGYGAKFGGTLIAVITGTSFIGCWLAPAAAERLGCRGIVSASNIMQVICLITISFGALNQALLVLFIGSIGFLMGLRDPVTYTMLSDTIDYGARVTGIRAVGVAYSSTTAAYKVAAGVGGALGAGMLGLSGYAGGASIQSDHVLLSIRVGFTVLPALILTAAAALIYLYPTDAAIRAAAQTPLC